MAGEEPRLSTRLVLEDTEGRPSFSPDGKTLALSRGGSNRDIVLIKNFR